MFRAEAVGAPYPFHASEALQDLKCRVSAVKLRNVRLHLRIKVENNIRTQKLPINSSFDDYIHKILIGRRVIVGN